MTPPSSLIRTLCCLFILVMLPVVAAAGQRVFIVYSYHPGYFWQQDEERGIREALKGMDLVFASYCLDSKRHQEESWLEQQLKICLEQIKAFQPDVIVTCDDNATRSVGRAFLKRKTPVVFLGLNGEPEDYGLVEAGKRLHPGGNITGVLERHYYRDAAALLQTILLANNVKVEKLDVVTDDSYTSNALLKFLRKKSWKTLWEQVLLPPASTFSQLKKQIQEINRAGHAACIYNLETLKDEAGRYVPDLKVITWTSQHLSMPSISFHAMYLERGAALCGVVVSGRTQGYHAGLKVKQILRGSAVGNIPVDQPPKGTVIVNVSVARRLGIRIPLEILLSADILYDDEK